MPNPDSNWIEPLDSEEAHEERFHQPWMAAVVSHLITASSDLSYRPHASAFLPPSIIVLNAPLRHNVLHHSPLSLGNQSQHHHPRIFELIILSEQFDVSVQYTLCTRQRSLLSRREIWCCRDLCELGYCTSESSGRVRPFFWERKSSEFVE